MRRFVFLTTILVGAVLAQPASAQQLDVIRGRVTGPDTMPIKDVNVKAISYQGNVTRATKTDKSGKYSLTFANGEGDYWLEFTAIGFTPKRFEVKRVADEEVLIADTRLTSNIATLEGVNVSANAARALVNRADPGGNAGGGVAGLNSNGLPPDQMGNLAAMASGIPGIQLIPGMDGAADMFSALGLDPSQNSTTFNGLGSGISVLPPDAAVTASVATISYDVGSGGYSGAQIILSSIPGSNYSARRSSGNAIPDFLEFADSVAKDQGAKNTRFGVGIGGSGPITLDRHFYNSSASFDRTFKDLPSLLNTSAGGLSGAGVAKDSADRLLGILANKGIPVSIANTPSQQATNTYRLQGNLDLTPSTSGAGNAFTVGYVGNFVNTDQVSQGAPLLTVPAHNGESSSQTHSVSLRHTNYFWFGILSNTTAGVSFASNSNEPYLRMPGGSVRINSDLADGSSAVRSLQFGGNPFLQNDSRNRSIAVNNQLRWYAGNNRHAVKMTTSIAHEQFTRDVQSNLLGSFSFNSLSDLESGSPASFSRVLSEPQQKGSQLTGAMSLGDYWRPGKAQVVQIQYGVRLDGNHFLKTPDENPEVREKFGVANTNLPNNVYVSPRVGFTWFYGKAPTIAIVPGAARPPRALVQGGVGLFQGIAAADLASSAVLNTGLPSSTQSISCIGPAAPIPDWNAYRVNPLSIPTACADGTDGTVFSNAAPSVTVFDPAYRQTKSWRTNLNWGGPILDNRFALGLSTIYSLNLNAVSSVDLNLNRTTRFTLDNEGGRPVYANAAAIDPRTGLVASRDTRISTDFQRVGEQRSDLRSESKQVVVTLKPVTANPKMYWQLSYQFNGLREKYRGFSSTVGDPFSTEWGLGQGFGQGGRHTFGVSWSRFPIFDVVYVDLGVSLTSGQLFTPSISGDVNGDGSGGNDRAFVYDPATTTDPDLAAAMQAVMANGSDAGRKCLAKQIGQLSSRNSCIGPWRTNATLSFSFNPQKIGLPKRTSINFSVTNPLGLVDLIAHGNDIRGWGQTISPDANLLSVRGFDPVTQHYKYEVNQRFGSTKPTQSTQRNLPLVSLRVTYDIGYARERQQLTQRLDMGRGRPGTKAPASLIKSMGSSSIPNPMALILQQPDSLKLTRKQADSLASLSRLFTLHADSLWTPVSKYLEGLPNGYSRGDAYDQYVHARELTVDYLITLVPKVKGLLTPAQKRRLPLQLMNYLDVRVLEFMRSSSAGVGGSPLIIRG